jgi:type IV secretory pathway VirB10-like protein
MTMAVSIALAIHLTHPAPKPAYNPNDLKQQPGAGDWANREAEPTPAPMAMAHPQPASPPHLGVNPAQPVYRQQPGMQRCEACEERERVLAAAQASDLAVKVDGVNALELPKPTSTPISTRPAAPNTVQLGTWIYAVLDTALNSDRPGDVLAHVSQPVYDTVTQSEVLIPEGSHLHGMVKDAGQLDLNNNSIAVAWDELRLPDGAEVALPNLPAADVDGEPGLSDKIDRHQLQLWGPAVLVSAITATMMLATTNSYGSTQGYNPTSQALGGFGTAMGQHSISNLNTLLRQIRPTIEVRKGTAIRVLVTHDLSFEGAYEG